MRRVLVFVSAIICFESALYTVLAPLLPHFSKEFALSKAEAGALSAAYAAGALVAALPSGLLTSRMGVKATAVAGVLLLGSASVVFGVAPTTFSVFLARFVQGCGSSLAWTGGFAWILSLSPRDRRGTVIGSVIAAAIFGTLLGPALGTVAAAAGSAPVFVALAAPAFALAILGSTLPSGPRQLLTVATFRYALVQRSLVGPALVIGLAGLLLGAMSVLAPLRLSHLGWSTTAIGGVFLATAATATLLNPMVGRDSDRRGRNGVLQGLLLLSGVACAVLAVDAGRWTYAAIVGAAGVAFALLWTPAMALLSDATASRELDFGVGFALMNLAWPPGQLVGSALGSALAQATTDTVLWLLAALLCFSTVALLRTVHENSLG